MAATIDTIARLSAREHLRIASSRGGDIAEVPDKSGALREASRVLDGTRAPHAVIGGVAVGIRSGIPRATLGTDVAVRSTAQRDEIIRALTAAAFTLRGGFAHSLLFRDRSGEPVQFVFDADFDVMINRAGRVDAGGYLVPVVGTSDLIAMKQRAAGDPARRRSTALRDRADIELLRGDVPDPDEGW